jgi:hypothetical protein
MNIFWAPKSSNKNVVQFQKYNIEKKNVGKKGLENKKNEKQIELFGHQKSSKRSDFLGDKKQKWNFLEKKSSKSSESFLKKTKMELFELLELFDFLFLIKFNKEK